MKITTLRLGATAALVAAAALLTACSDSGSSASKTESAAAGSSTPATSSAPSGPAAVSTASGPAGSYLVDSTGKAIYILTSDKPNGGATACTLDCLKFWPPIPAPATTPTGLTGITATFGTFKALDGSNEMTINGYPAYNFASDKGPGTTLGQGKVSFGGTWWLVSPTGAWITSAGTASSPAASSSAAANDGGYKY